MPIYQVIPVIFVTDKGKIAEEPRSGILYWCNAFCSEAEQFHRQRTRDVCARLIRYKSFYRLSTPISRKVDPQTSLAKRPCLWLIPLEVAFICDVTTNEKNGGRWCVAQAGECDEADKGKRMRSDGVRQRVV